MMKIISRSVGSRKINGIMVIVSVFSLLCVTQSLHAAGKWGYVNTKGDMVIKASYDIASTFSDKRGAVRLDGMWGFIDTSGTMVIPAQFAQVYPFESGVTSVKYWGKPEWYLININGKLLNEKGFSDPLFFSEGYAVFKENGKTGYVDTNGIIVIKPVQAWMGIFSDGLAAMTLEKGYAFIDKKGDIKIPGPFQEVDPFHNGYAHVKVKGLSANIDVQGNYVIPPKYSYLGAFNEGRASVRIDGKWGYFDTTGTLIIKPKYQFAATFKYGMAMVTIANKSGFIDKDGKVIIDLVYDSVELVGTQAIRTVTGGKTLYINLKGDPFSAQPIAWMAYELSGYHIYQDDKGKWGHLYKDGTIAVKPSYRSAGGFSDGLAPVQLWE